MKKIIIVLVVIGLVAIGSYSYYQTLGIWDDGTDYFVSNAGDDNNDGLTPATAWRTKTKVNQAMQYGPIENGDNIYFRRGDTFDDDVSILLRYKVGLDGNPMIFGAYGNENDPKPIITRTSPRSGVYLNGANIGGWTFENLNFVGFEIAHSCRSFSMLEGAFYDLHIKNCDFNQNWLLMQNAHGVIIEDCTNYISAIDFECGYHNEDIIIRNCFLDGGHVTKDCLCIHYPGGTAATEMMGTGNTFYIENVHAINGLEDSFDIVGGENVVDVYLKDCKGENIIIGHANSEVLIDGYSGRNIYFTESNDVIIRNSILERDGDRDNFGVDDPQFPDNMPSCHDIYIYNNVVKHHGPAGSHFQINNGATDVIYLGHLRVKNNVFFTDTSGGSIVKYQANGDAIWGLDNTDSQYTNNIWWQERPFYTEADGTMTFTEWLAKPEVIGDILQDPQIGTDNMPLSGSLCIDGGTHLTATISSGSGNVIPVEDAGYFFDGMPTLGIQGDEIRVGGNHNLVITNVDYDTNEITVDRSINWDSGDYVDLPYSGSSPDIGLLSPVLASDDADSDGIVDQLDNCPFTYNPDQEDSNSDGIGDACESIPDDDFDDDGILDHLDNCPAIYNPDQLDSDNNGKGDVCDKEIVETPGFEVLIIIISILSFAYWRKQK